MTAFFMGTYEHALDAKGRLIVPSKLRDQVKPEVDGDGFVITRGPEVCLFLYTINEWKSICEAQSQLPRGSEQLRQFQRLWYANAEPLAIDRQGRILVPERLRTLASIDRDIVLAGCYDRIEIWSKERWEEEQATARRNYSEKAQEFLGGGTPSQPDPE